jgi:hypothetical protein
VSTWFTEKYYLLAKTNSDAWDALNKFMSVPGSELELSDFGVAVNSEHTAGTFYSRVTIDVQFNARDPRCPKSYCYFIENYPQYGIERYHYQDSEEAMILGLQPIWVRDEDGNGNRWFFETCIKKAEVQS